MKAMDLTTARTHSPNKMEDIHQALAKMIGLDQIPISLCSCNGYWTELQALERRGLQKTTSITEVGNQ